MKDTINKTVYILESCWASATVNSGVARNWYPTSKVYDNLEYARAGLSLVRDINEDNGEEQEFRIGRYVRQVTVGRK